MNALIVVSLVIDGLLTLVVGAGDSPVMGYVMGAFFALQLIGVIMIAAGSRKPGAIVMFIGCVGFVPIGLIGAMGGRKVLDQLKTDEFEARRRELEKPAA